MSEREWYYMEGDTQQGPIPEQQLTALLHERLGPATYVWTPGMDDWCQASRIPNLFPQAAPAAPGAPARPLASQAYAPTRPTAVTVFGILNIVFGGIGLLALPFSLIVIFAAPDGPEHSEAYIAWMVIASIIGLGCTILLLASGIGLLGLKSWARTAAYAYGWFAVIWGILGMVVNFALISGGEYGNDEAAVIGAIAGTFGGLIGLIYPILLIVFMRKPNVIDACNK